MMPLPHRRWPLVLVLVFALLASLTSLGNGFALDDIPIILENTRVHALSAPWELLGQTYWPPAHGAALYRPLTILGFAVQWVAGHGAPLVFHLVSVALYAAVSLAVFRLASVLLPAGAALVSAVYFAVQPVHVEAVGNVVGQSELLVALCFTLAVTQYVRGRQRGGLSALDGVVIGVLYASGLMAKEHAIVLPAVLLLYEVLLVETSEDFRSRIRRLLPAYLGMVAVAAIFWTVRTRVTGGLVGRDWHPAFRSGDSAVRIWTALGVLPEYLRLLLFPLHLSADYNPQEIAVADGPGLPQLLGLGVLALVVVAVLWGRARRPVLAFGIGWAAVALFPVSNLLLPTGILLAERTLFLPSIGFGVALGAAVQASLDRWPSWTVLQQRMLLTGALVLAIAGAARSAARQPVWRDNATLFNQTAVDAPRSYRARAARAVLWIESGRESEGEREYLAALALYRDDASVIADLANYYVGKARFADALPLYHRVLELVPDHWTATSRSILCLIQLHRLEEAKALAETATRRGDEGAAAKLAYVDSLIVRRTALPDARAPVSP